MIKKYSEIEKIGKDCIFFDDGTKIQINDCVRKDTNTCIAERDITATPPYFDFFTGDKIIFDKKGLFSKSKNKKDFQKLQLQLQSMGYTTYDLSWKFEFTGERTWNIE